MAEERKRVVLVDDHELARQGLRRMLELEEDMEVVGEASTVEEAVERVAALSPDIVLMDIKMPTSNGLEATRQLKEKGLAGEVIILSLYDEYLAQAIEAGAGGYLVKDVKREELASAIRRVHKGELVLATSILASPASVEGALRRFREVTHSRTKNKPPQPAGVVTHAPEVRAPSPDEARSAGEGHKPSFPPGSTAEKPPAPPMASGMESNPGQAFLHPSARPAEAKPTYHARGVTQAAATGQEEATELQGASEGTPTGKKPDEAQAQKLTRYDEEAEMIIPPPVDAQRLLSLSRRLHEHHVEIMETVGSWEGGTWMRLLLRRPIALKEVLAQMPEVIQVWEAAPEDGGFLPAAADTPTDAPAPEPWLRLVVKITGDPEQLTLAI